MQGGNLPLRGTVHVVTMPCFFLIFYSQCLVHQGSDPVVDRRNHTSRDFILDRYWHLHWYCISLKFA